jgi:hypothetical protein
MKARTLIKRWDYKYIVRDIWLFRLKKNKTEYKTKLSPPLLWQKSNWSEEMFNKNDFITEEIAKKTYPLCF